MPSTRAVLVGALLALLGWEAWTLVNRRDGDTISDAVWETTDRAPVITFLVGLLCGHWFWPRRREE